MLKSARMFSAERHSRDTKVRDAVRDRDAPAINEAVLTIVADGVEKMTRIRKGQAPASSMERVTEVVDWGIRTFASYVGEAQFPFSNCEISHLFLHRLD